MCNLVTCSSIEGCCNAVQKNQHKTKNFNLLVYDCKDWLQQIGKASCGAVSCIGNAGVLQLQCAVTMFQALMEGLEVVRSRQKGPILQTFTKLKYSIDRFYLFIFFKWCLVALLQYCHGPLYLGYHCSESQQCAFVYFGLETTKVAHCFLPIHTSQCSSAFFTDEDIRIQKNDVI